jgi:hypothetical protein
VANADTGEQYQNNSGDFHVQFTPLQRTRRAGVSVTSMVIIFFADKCLPNPSAGGSIVCPAPKVAAARRELRRRERRSPCRPCVVHRTDVLDHGAAHLERPG